MFNVSHLDQSDDVANFCRPPAGTYRASYDLSDSRRSPRDQSPPRYNDRNDRNERNDRDDYRTGPHTTERRRSIPDLRSDTRTNSNGFNSNRDTFRESMGRDSSREFPPRDPPRGPKSLIEPPTGPRASASNYSDYRADRNEYHFRGGDYRGDRGRGRGRGWRDDSRDRSRDLIDRVPFRRDRDDRGPTHFRDDSNRERYSRETYPRGRRPSSPLGRARSPPYGPRDNRDAPPNIEVDRARRGSRDGPLSGGSPSSEGVPFTRGFGRLPRGGRGRGRGGYYDDHRRSRSPESGWSRRTQPSATPPPQVPAFGSNLPVAAAAAAASIPIPTAPKAQRRVDGLHRIEMAGADPKQDSRDVAVLVRKELTDKILATMPKGQSENPLQSSLPPQISSELGPSAQLQDVRVQDSTTEKASESFPKRKGWHVTGARPPKPIISDDSDVEDSGDDLPDNYFVDEIARIKQAIAVLEKFPVVGLREDPNAPFLKPLIDANITARFTKAKELANKVFSHPKGPPQPKVDNKLLEPSVEKSTSELASLPEKKVQAQQPELVKLPSNVGAIDEASISSQPPSKEVLVKSGQDTSTTQQGQAQIPNANEESFSGPVDEATSTNKLSDLSTKKDVILTTPVEESEKSSIPDESIPQELDHSVLPNLSGVDKTAPVPSERLPSSSEAGESSSLIVRDAQKDHDALNNESAGAQTQQAPPEGHVSSPDHGRGQQAGDHTETISDIKVVEASHDSQKGLFDKFDGFASSSTRPEHHKATSPTTLTPSEGSKTNTKQDAGALVSSKVSSDQESSEIPVTQLSSTLVIPPSDAAQEDAADDTVPLPSPQVSNNETPPSLINDTDDADNTADLIERTRAQMKTPDINSLPHFDCLPFSTLR